MTIKSLDEAIHATLVYADIFDQPLTLGELHRYLHGCRASRAEISARLVSLRIEKEADWLCLPGREPLFAVRRRREEAAGRLWPAAVRWGRRLAALPFVRLAAVTGALAVNNVETGADIDFLLVTAPGRIWTCRLLSLILVRAASLRGIEICPNYLLTTRTLALADRSIFTARELAQMVPLSGSRVYAEMRTANPWVDEMLPNAGGPPRPELFADAVEKPSPWERLLPDEIGNRLENWEMKRKQKKFAAHIPLSDEIAFEAERVQGHAQGYRARTLAEFERRLSGLQEAG